MAVSTIFANAHVFFPQHCASVFRLFTLPGEADGAAGNDDVDVGDAATDEVGGDIREVVGDCVVWHTLKTEELHSAWAPQGLPKMVHPAACQYAPDHE